VLRYYNIAHGLVALTRLPLPLFMVGGTERMRTGLRRDARPLCSQLGPYEPTPGEELELVIHLAWPAVSSA